MFSLEGLNSFITGGTAGIGLATARRFRQAGANVVIVGRRAEGESIAEEIGAIFIRADVGKEDQLASAFADAVAKVGKLDIVMNNAAFDNTGPLIDESDAAEFQRGIDVNLMSVYNGLRYGPRHMNDGGSIINISSLAAKTGIPGYSQYCAIKAAVCSLSLNAAVELGGRRIRVNSVLPGSVWSEMLPKGQDHPEAAATTRYAPLGRVGEPEDVAALCHFLASPDCSYITGQAIVIDGGISRRW